MIILSNEELIGLLQPSDLIAAVEAAVVGVMEGRVLVPKRIHADWQGNTLLTMPAWGERGFFGTKLVAVVPGNAGRGLPVTNGLMVLNDGETGLPVAVMNAGMVTAQRTGAVGSLGVKYMTPADVSSVGIVGCGVQGAWQAIFACAVRPVREVFCVDQSDAAVARFAATVTERVGGGVRVTRCGEVGEMVERAPVVITATTSNEPVLPDEPALLEGRHFVSIGSFRPSMQELPDSVYRLAGSVAVDSEHAAHEVGDLMNPLRQGILRDDDVYSIAECVVGRRVVDVSRTTAYKTVGMAAYDLYAAQAFYEAAKARGVGREVAI